MNIVGISFRRTINTHTHRNIRTVNAKCGCFNQRFPFGLTTLEKEEGEEVLSSRTCSHALNNTNNKCDESHSNKANLSRLSTLLADWLYTPARKKKTHKFSLTSFSHTLTQTKKKHRQQNKKMDFVAIYFSFKMNFFLSI